MTKGSAQREESPSQLIDARIEELGDWRGETLARVRALIKQADPEVVEEWKWRGVPVWSHAGIICTGETYKSVVKMTFAKGASLEDPSGLFNSSLEGNTRRAIDFHEGDEIDEKAFETAPFEPPSVMNESRRAGRAAARLTAAQDRSLERRGASARRRSSKNGRIWVISVAAIPLGGRSRSTSCTGRPSCPCQRGACPGCPRASG